MRTCKTCGIEKLRADFTENRFSCKKCRYEQQRKRVKTENKIFRDVWSSMVGRCHNEKHISYKYYGAKGIEVCERWRYSFSEFFNDMQPRPEGTSLDRIDSSGNYCKENCRWATIKEQNNNRSSTKMISFQGLTMNMSDWARHLGVAPAALHYRISRMKMPIDLALTIPFTRKGRKERFGEFYK